MSTLQRILRVSTQHLITRPNAGDLMRHLSTTFSLTQKDDYNQTPCAKTNCDPASQMKPVRLPGLDEDSVFKGMEADFPCLNFLKSPSEGPEPKYNVNKGYKLFEYVAPFAMRYNGGRLPGFSLAYETWGELNDRGDNAVIVWSGMSASSHCKSSAEDPSPGWWEDFIGPDCAIDTNKFFVICTNHLGSCFGSTGPSSVNKLTNRPYAMTFPIVSVDDLVKSTFLLLDHLGVDKLHSSLGSSLGGMCSLTSGALYPERVGKVISISACAATHPASMAMRYVQRRTIMFDPNWNRGDYYSGATPRLGVKMAREIAFITYRSGPEWDGRFGRKRVDPSQDVSFCPDFLIEKYLDYQGTTSCTKFDANTLLYLSKAMDLFDLSEGWPSMTESLARITSPVMIVGVQTDSLIPVTQQRQLAKLLTDAGNKAVTYFELNSLFGHDTFLLDVNSVGAAVKGFLETNINKKNGRNIFMG